MIRVPVKRALTPCSRFTLKTGLIESGFRLCLVYAGFYIASLEKTEGGLDNNFNPLGEGITEGHEDLVIVGVPVHVGEKEGG